MDSPNKKVKIPNDNFASADIKTIRIETTLAGNIRFAGDCGNNVHADMFLCPNSAVFGEGDGI